MGDLFRRKLENHEMPVEDWGWDEIERRLNSSKNNTTKVWMWRFATMAAAASVAIFLFFRISKNEPIQSIQETAKSEEINVIKSDTIIHNVPTPKQIEQPQNIVQPERNAQPAQNVQPERNAQLAQTNDQEPNNSLTALNDSVTPLPNDSVTQLLSHSLTQSLNDSVSQLLSYSATPSVVPSLSYSVSFGVGGGGFGDMNNESLSDQMSYVGVNSSGNNYAVELSSSILSIENISVDNFRNITHNPPFSIGVTARKYFGKKIAIESGIMYTQLSSEFEMWNYNVHQSLHYIGIPVNLSTHFGNSKSNNWRFYVFGGFILDKGVRAIYKQEQNFGNQIYTTTVKTSIDGLQWSLSSGLGARYRLEKGWGVYLEPRLGYSFKNNQPISIRTEWPVYFGINLGINYEL